MVEFILGGAGSGKSSLMTDEIKNSAENGRKVIVIVPEQFSFDSDKKLYKKLGCHGFNKILSLSFTSITKEIFEKYGSRSGEYADDMSKIILMKKTIKKLVSEKQLKFFARQALKPDFVGEALKIVTEFRQSGVGADDFTARMTVDDVTLSDKISDLALIYYTYDKMLLDNDLKDSLTNISEAAAIAEMNDFFSGTEVYFDEFESFTGDEYQLIDAIISQADKVCISLRLESGQEGRNEVFESVRNTWKKFYQTAKKYGKPIETKTLEKPLKYHSDDLSYLNMNIFRPVREYYGKSENIRVTECTDMYEEADWICTEILKLVRDEGYKYKEISVLSRNLNDYTYILEAAFEKYDIPYLLDVKKSVMHTSIMLYLSAIAEIIAQKNFTTDLVLKYAKTHLSGMSVSRVSELENYCFEWDIEGKRWLEPFHDDNENYHEVEETRRMIIEPLNELRKKCASANGSEICRYVFEFISKMEVQRRVNGVIADFEENGLTYLAKEFKRIWGMMVDILDCISDVGSDMDVEDFKDVFLMMMRQITYSVPPQTLDGVRISPAETSRPDSPSAVFLIGANEGYFPADIVQTGLLNERDRLMFEQSGISLSRTNEELIADEKLIVYKTFTHATKKLYVTYPLADSMGTHRYPSTVLKQLTGMYGKEVIESSKEKSLIDYCATKKSAYFNLVRYFGDNNSEVSSVREVLERDTEYRLKLDTLKNIADSKGIWEVTDKELMKKLYGNRLNISATAIEDYNICHFRYFCKTGLKLRIRRKRIIDRIGEGNLTHRCLEMILGSCSTKEEFDSLTSEKINELIGKCSKEFIDETFGMEAKNIVSVPDMLEKINKNISELVSHLQNELRQSEFRPVAFELDVSQGNDNPVLKAENGVEIYLKGYVDRVDVFETDGEKYLRVIDYKTGNRKFSIASLLYGINMQMLIYMFSITQKERCFDGYSPAGVLYMPSGGAGCGRDRDSNESIEDYLTSHYKMNGVVLSDRTVLNAMEKDIRGIFIPASLTSSDKGSGELLLNKRSSSCLTKKNFEKLREYTDNILLKMCEELYDGKIEADPYFSSAINPCSYCEYWSVCGNFPAESCHEESEDAHEIMMEKLRGDDDDKVE